MAVSQYYVLNMSPGGVPLTIHVSQYDANSRTLVFTLYNNDEEFTVPGGSTVTARFTKASGNASTENCTFTGNVVSYVVSDQLTLYPGKVSTELRITNGTEVIGSANFYVVVESATIDADTAISEDDLPILETVIQTVDSFSSELSSKLDAPESTGTAGQVLTLDSNLDPVWITPSDAVDSVNGMTGTVVLTASDVGALPDSTTIPSKTSQLQNDSGFLSTAVTSFNGNTGAVTYTAPVTSVNSKTGAVTLTASDVGAVASSTYEAMLSSFSNPALLINEKSIPTSATSYSCNWSEYDYLLICTMFYGNITSTAQVPCTYMANTSSVQRVMLLDSAKARHYEIWAGTTSSLTVLASEAASTEYGIRVYGVRL